MQTFLPDPSFERSAELLDYRRLGKQRVETLQILNALAGLSKGWVNHPATNMWRGHRLALVRYGLAMCDEWVRRGYRDSCRAKISMHADVTSVAGEVLDPDWLGDPQVHGSHRSNLLRKDPVFYGQYGWTEPDNLPSVWVAAAKQAQKGAPQEGQSLQEAGSALPARKIVQEPWSSIVQK